MIYILNLLFLILCAYFTRKKTGYRFFAKVSAIQLILLMGLRKFTVGSDSANYLRLFKGIANGSHTSLDLKSPVYVIGLRLIAAIAPNYEQIYFVATAVIIIVLLWRTIALLKVPFKKAVITYYLSFFLISLNLNRTFVAIALVMYAYALMRNKKIGFAILVEIIAVLVHATALVGVAVLIIGYLDTDSKKSRKKILGGIIVGTLFYRMSFGIFIRLFPVYENTLENVNDTVGASALIFQIGIMMLLVYILYLQKKMTICKCLNGTQVSNLKNISLVLFLAIAIYIVGGSTWYIQRIIIYLNIIAVFAFPLCDLVKNKYRMIFRTSYYIIFGFVFLYRIFRNLGGISPYLFYWQ